MQRHNYSRDHTACRRSRGLTLLMVLVVMTVTSLLLIGVLDSATSEMAAVRNTADYERALYLAGAAAHHALVEIEADPNWLETIGPIEYPSGSGDSYTASAASGTGGSVVITASGTAGTVTRRLQVTILPNG